MNPATEQLIREIHAAVLPNASESFRELTRRCRDVVAARHYQGDDGWSRLKSAISELEGLVGRPDNAR